MKKYLHVADVVNDNIKDKTGVIKNICGIKGNISKDKFKIELSKCVTPETNVYKELGDCIFYCKPISRISRLQRATSKIARHALHDVVTEVLFEDASDLNLKRHIPLRPCRQGRIAPPGHMSKKYAAPCRSTPCASR